MNIIITQWVGGGGGGGREAVANTHTRTHTHTQLYTGWVESRSRIGRNRDTCRCGLTTN